MEITGNSWQAKPETSLVWGLPPYLRGFYSASINPFTYRIAELLKEPYYYTLKFVLCFVGKLQ